MAEQEGSEPMSHTRHQGDAGQPRPGFNELTNRPDMILAVQNEEMAEQEGSEPMSLSTKVTH